jgi:hypothetical protein
VVEGTATGVFWAFRGCTGAFRVCTGAFRRRVVFLVARGIAPTLNRSRGRGFLPMERWW